MATVGIYTLFDNQIYRMTTVEVDPDGNLRELSAAFRAVADDIEEKADMSITEETNG